MAFISMKLNKEAHTPPVFIGKIQINKGVTG